MNVVFHSLYDGAAIAPAAFGNLEKQFFFGGVWLRVYGCDLFRFFVVVFLKRRVGLIYGV